jgi:hypothetical protein
MVNNMIKIKILKEKEHFIGGAADNLPDSDFDPILLKKGQEKEMRDHGLNASDAAEIAKDELKIDQETYSKELGESYNHKQFIDWLKNNKKSVVKQEEGLLLSEAKLSKYWKKRAKRRALKAERQWPNKHDRDWALTEQEKSAKINEKVYALFEKELEEASCMSDDVDKMMRRMKKNRKTYLKKREALKIEKQSKFLHPSKKPKKNLSSYPPPHEEGEGVAKRYRKVSARSKTHTAAAGEIIGSGMNEEKKNENN